MKIDDGTGSGRQARVNPRNQIEVSSEALSAEGAAARRAESFVIHAECHTAAAASGGFLHIENNDSNNDVEITRIYIDAHTITPTDLIVTQIFDAVITNGSDVSATSIIQKNRRSSETFNLTVTISDVSSDMSVTNGDQYHAFPVTSMSSQQRNMNNTNIIPAGKSVLFGYKTRGGGNATDGEIVSFSVNVVKRPSV